MEASKSHPTPPVAPPPPLNEDKDKETDASESSDDGAMPLEIDVHGLKAKVFLNCADADIIPPRYLEKADRCHILKRVPWIFRAETDGRTANLNKWSKVDLRFRGVFKTLKKVPPFVNGMYHEDAGDIPSSAAAKLNFEDAVTAQGQVVYALMDDILNMMKITREMEDNRSYFYLRPRLLTCNREYWTGYRVKHRDTPCTAGSISVDFEPQRGIPRAVVPVLTTDNRNRTLKAALVGEFKLLLAQLLVNVHRLSPPGDKIPDQEAFLISLHGSRLHILRGIFPGQKTSRLWCGRHNSAAPEGQSTHNLITKMNDRFYTKQNLERFIEQVEWNQLSDPDNEANPRVFQVFGSREYDLWKKWEFAAATKMLGGLALYLMSGQARCGILQVVFERWPYDEGLEPESEDEKEAEKAAKEQQKRVEEQEKKLKEAEQKQREEAEARYCQREAMRTSLKDRIPGFNGFRKPWWDWVWDDGHKDGFEKTDDADVILRGP